MHQVFTASGCLFEYAEHNSYAVGDAIVVTINGERKTNGELVMGKGIALEFAKRFPQLPALAGEQVAKNGLCVFPIRMPSLFNPTIICFPTKHSWRDSRSSIPLIADSARQLRDIAGMFKRILMTRPGCGCGNLDWETVRWECLYPLETLENVFIISSAKDCDTE